MLLQQTKQEANGPIVFGHLKFVEVATLLQDLNTREVRGKSLDQCEAILLSEVEVEERGQSYFTFVRDRLQNQVGAKATNSDLVKDHWVDDTSLSVVHNSLEVDSIVKSADNLQRLLELIELCKARLSDLDLNLVAS